MSNEKPVRITVGDVKEVIEATAIQVDSPIANSVSGDSHYQTTQDTTGNGWIYLGGLVCFLLFVLAGYIAMTQKVEGKAGAKSDTVKTSPAASNVKSEPTAANTEKPADPTANSTNTPAGLNMGDSSKDAKATSDVNMAASNSPAK